MDRRKFIGMASGALIAAGAGGYILSDKENLEREDLDQEGAEIGGMMPDERKILYLASLAPSGHNTQPWFIQYLAPYHWIIGNDMRKWLKAVDPGQRETILSIGAFIQNLEYAADNSGYSCDFKLLGTTNQDAKIMEVKLEKKNSGSTFDIEKIISRRTVRSGYLSDPLKSEDEGLLIEAEKDFIHYLPAESNESRYINEQTIEANRIQAYRDPAQRELADWIRFSSIDAAKFRDGLTTASMEIEGLSGWILRNFYGKSSVMGKDFRDRGIDKVREQVRSSAGWILITSRDDSVMGLIECGKRMQRLFLKVRERNIAIHPMTQILEEAATRQELNRNIGISEDIKFILRAGYLNYYPPPVSLRRPVGWFLKK